MSVVEVIVTPLVKAYVYDGTNGQEILDLLGPQRLALDENDALCLKLPFSLDPIPVGNYVTVTAGVVPGTGYSDPVGFTTVTAPPVYLAVGIEAVPSLGAGGNATVDVTIIPTLPNTSYDAAAWLAGSVTLLGGLSITSVTLLNTSTIRVVVHNGALVTLAGGTLIATAVAA